MMQHQSLSVFSVYSSCVHVHMLMFFLMHTFFSSKLLCNKNKTVLGTGDILKFTKLAESLETIAKQGADAFYTGKMGQDLIKDIKDAGWCKFQHSLTSWGFV